MIRTSSRMARLIRRAAALAALVTASAAGVFLAPALVSAQPQQQAQVETAPVVLQSAAAQGAEAAPRKVRVIKLFDVPPEQMDGAQR